MDDCSALAQVVTLTLYLKYVFLAPPGALKALPALHFFSHWPSTTTLNHIQAIGLMLWPIDNLLNHCPNPPFPNSTALRRVCENFETVSEWVHERTLNTLGELWEHIWTINWLPNDSWRRLPLPCEQHMAICYLLMIIIIINDKVDRGSVVRAARTPQPTTNQPTGHQRSWHDPYLPKNDQNAWFLGGSKSFCTYISENHLVTSFAFFWSGTAPNGPERPNDQKCQFWAKYGLFWANNLNFWRREQFFGTVISWNK